MQNWKNHFDANPEIRYGKPVIRGTCIRADMIPEKMSDGQPHQENIRDYPDLEKEDLLACLSHVTPLLRNETVIPLAP